MQWIPSEQKEQPEQEPVSTIRAMTDQVAALVWERDELQKQVWLYEKNGVTCQTYRHAVEQSCSECNVQMNYATPPQREWQSLTDDEIKEIIGSYAGPIKGYTRELFDKIDAKLREKNSG